MSTRPPTGSSHLVASTTPRKGTQKLHFSHSFHARSRSPAHISRKMAYAFGSSTPRDFSYLDHVPYRYRVYDVPIENGHPKRSEHTLSDYMKEAHGRSRSRPRDRSLDSSLHRMYVFGSSTPRELSYMDKVSAPYRVYDVRLASAPPTTKRSKTTSFSTTDKRYNTRRTSSMEQISRPPRKQVRSRMVQSAKVPPRPRPHSQHDTTAHKGRAHSPKKEPAVDKVVTIASKAAPSPEVSVPSPIRKVEAEVTESKPIDHIMEATEPIQPKTPEPEDEPEAVKEPAKTISLHEETREVEQCHENEDDDQKESSPAPIFQEDKHEVSQWDDGGGQKSPVSSSVVFHEERREVRQWDDEPPSKETISPHNESEEKEEEEKKDEDDDPSLLDRMGAVLNEKLLGNDPPDQEGEESHSNDESHDVQDVITRTHTTTVTSEEVSHRGEAHHLNGEPTQSLPDLPSPRVTVDAPEETDDGNAESRTGTVEEEKESDASSSHSTSSRKSSTTAPEPTADQPHQSY